MYIVNSIFSWILLVLSVAGYVFTQRRFGERWFAWALLGAGWTFFAIAQTILATGQSLTLATLLSLCLSSYVLVISAIVLLFLKLINIRNTADHSIKSN